MVGILLFNDPTLCQPKHCLSCGHLRRMVVEHEKSSLAILKLDRCISLGDVTRLVAATTPSYPANLILFRWARSVSQSPRCIFMTRVDEMARFPLAPYLVLAESPPPPRCPPVHEP